jgi:hypothetical protein
MLRQASQRENRKLVEVARQILRQNSPEPTLPESVTRWGGEV